MKTENFTKGNLFNELQEKYPDGMKVFCDWVDKYKKENDWDRLFNNYAPASPHDDENMHMVKFHDIPRAMQIGIYIQFVKETFPTIHEWEIEDLNEYDWREDITGAIKLLHEDESIQPQLCRKKCLN